MPLRPALGVEPTPAGLARHRETWTRRLLAAADAAAGLTATTVVMAWVDGDWLTPVLLPLVALLLMIVKIGGLYDRDELVLRRSTLDEVPALAQIAAVYALCVAACSGDVFDVRPGPQQLVVLWIAVSLLLSIARVIARRVAKAFVAPERCLVIGDVMHVDHVRRKVECCAGSAVVVDSVVVTSDMFAVADQVEALIDPLDIHRVVVAPMAHAGRDTNDLVRRLKARGMRVSIVPAIFEAVGSAVEFEQLDGLTVLGVRRFGLNRSTRMVKRAFDIAIGSAALIASVPMLLLLAALVRLDSAGPVFFRQVRIGRDGHPFRIWKFRTMITDAESLKDQLREENETVGLFKLSDDPRVTRVGRMLRRTSLDELPQIFNVLRGEMSLVGPRPLVVDEDALVHGLDRARLYLTPGMTGPWQVLGSTRVPMDEMLGIDYLYVANWTLWQDIKILLRTVQHVLGGRGL